MDIQQPATLAESPKAPIVVGSGDWLGRANKDGCGFAVYDPNAANCKYENEKDVTD